MLYIVSTPIGNPEDITLRALRILRESDAVVCEERREGARLLHRHDITGTLIELNEHTERAVLPELLARLARAETLALISDHGTPLLTDPGHQLVSEAIRRRIPVRAVPGASSLLAALVVSGLPIDRFAFKGLLPPKKEQRKAALERLREERETWIILDTPYRLAPLLDDLLGALGPKRHIVVACELTKPAERIVRGSLQEVVRHFREQPFKGEYVIAVGGK